LSAAVLPCDNIKILPVITCWPVLNVFVSMMISHLLLCIR
jgi:hypothetical protein